MKAEFESMFKGMAAATEGGGAAPDAAGGADGAAPAGDESFQDTIRRTMERMQSSGDQATAAAASGGSDDFMSELLKQMASGAGGAGGEGGEEEFSKMLMGMMEQLTNKEILYEPMKELHDKFPAWLAANGEKTGAEELKRYEDQHALVNEIVARFEASTYSDSNAADREYIVERMQKVSCTQRKHGNKDLGEGKAFFTNGTVCRCRSWARRRRIWWEISTQHRRPLLALMSNVTHSSRRTTKKNKYTRLYLHDQGFFFMVFFWSMPCLYTHAYKFEDVMIVPSRKKKVGQL